MKSSKFVRASLAAALSLGVAASFSACGRTGTNNTVDYVYVTSSKIGQVSVYYLDHQSGTLTQIPDSPYPSGGSNPVALATSPDFKSLYVVNNGEGGSAGSGIVQFGIGSDAKLYPQHTYQGPAGSSLSVPNAVAVNSAGTLLFVTYTYIAAGASSLNPSSGALVVYPINKDGSLGTPVSNGSLPYFTLTANSSEVLTPIAVAVVDAASSSSTSGTFVYVVAQNSTTGTGSIVAFSVGSSGSVSPLPCETTVSSCNANGDGTFNVGTAPNAIAATPLGKYLYVTDGARNQLLSYAIQSSGQVVALPSGPARTDVFPDGVTVDPRGEFVYVANYTANNIGAYAINPSSSPGLTSVGTYGAGTGPTCVFVEPARGSYIYTTNFLDNTVSGLNLSSTDGTLAPVQNTPFGVGGQPTCIAATPHGTNPPITPAN
jgi:6-phosphogluconolactonase